MARRIVRKVPKKQKSIPTLAELREQAYEHGMTVKEYVNHLNQIHSDRTNSKNKSASYDRGPIPYNKPRKKKEDDDG